MSGRMKKCVRYGNDTFADCALCCGINDANGSGSCAENAEDSMRERYDRESTVKGGKK